VRHLVQRVLLLLLGFYRSVVSPGLGRRCRYYPSCSTYAMGCIEQHGALSGTVRAAWRLLRCNPLSRGGYDPVPAARVPRNGIASCGRLGVSAVPMKGRHE